MGMRGDERVQDGMFSYVSLEQRVPQDHPLRAVRKLTDAVLRALSPEFDALYADSGRPSVAPEYILLALLLQAFYERRALHGGWHADSGVGLAEELSLQRRLRWRRRRRFSRSEAEQQDA